MAGAGYKLFNTGDVLTAAQVNTYLMEQTVMVFADAAARTAALSGVVSEGMISYLKDTNAVEVYNGSAWVASDDPNAIQNTIVDAKGDLITATAADVPARLAVGNNGETLVADSSASTGLRWQGSNAAGKNVVINGGFDVWQRGTSFTIGSDGGLFSADRWKGSYTGTGINNVITRETDVPNSNVKYSLKSTQTGGNATSLTTYAVRTFIEQSTILPLLGKSAILSFWYKSSVTGTHAVRVNGTENTGGTNQNTTFTVNSANTWEFKTLAVTAFSGVTASSATDTDRGGFIDIGPASQGSGLTSFAQNATFFLAQVQLEVGSVPTTFTRAGGTLAGEFQACARYYYRTAGQGNYAPTGISGVGQSTTTANGFFLNPVAMRTNATAIEFSNIAFYDGTNVTALTNMTLDDAGITSQRVGMNAAAGLTQYRPGFAIRNNNAAGYVAFSAEL